MLTGVHIISVNSLLVSLNDFKSYNNYKIIAAFLYLVLLNILCPVVFYMFEFGIL